MFYCQFGFDRLLSESRESETRNFVRFVARFCISCPEFYIFAGVDGYCRNLVIYAVVGGVNDCYYYRVLLVSINLIEDLFVRNRLNVDVLFFG